MGTPWDLVPPASTSLPHPLHISLYQRRNCPDTCQAPQLEKAPGWGEDVAQPPPPRPVPALCEAVGDHGLPDAAHQHPSLIATHCLMTVIRKSKAAWGLEALTELGEPDGVRT